MNTHVPGIARWHMFAGGTGERYGRHGYRWPTNFGNYVINPLSNRAGYKTGYSLTFENVKGLVPGGLNQEMGLVRSPVAGAKLAREHYAMLTDEGVARNPKRDWHEDRYRTLVRERLAADVIAREAETDEARRSHAMHRQYLTGKVDEEAVALGQYPRRRRAARNPGAAWHKKLLRAEEARAELAEAGGDRVAAAHHSASAWAQSMGLSASLDPASREAMEKAADESIDAARRAGLYRHNTGRKRRGRRKKTGVKRNPGTDMGSLMKHPGFRKALKLYRQIHGCDPKSVKRVILPVGDEKKITSTDFFVALGKAPADSYEPNDRQSQKYGKIWVHPYDHKPIKAVDKTGKFIVTLPGSHRVKAGADGEAWIHGN